MLRLMAMPAFGSRARSRVLAAAGSLLTDFLDDPHAWKIVSLTDAQRAELAASRRADITLLAEMLDRTAIRFLLPDDEGFPQALHHQADAPIAVFLRGAPIVDGVRVAIVGTRRMTDYGKRTAARLAGDLARRGVTVVSGLAIGVDATAHAACLDTDGRTIAVLPGGTDDASVAPPRHRMLARRIVEHGGTLLSEHPPGAPVYPFSFLHRNRLIAALADAVVVVEGDRDSGALVTARLALECGREALAVPGSVWSDASRGTNELIKQGARPCTDADDVFAAIGMDHPDQVRHVNAARATLPVSPEDAPILEALAEPHTVDELSRLLNQPIAVVNAAVSLLELKGRIVTAGPRTFVRAEG